MATQNSNTEDNLFEKGGGKIHQVSCLFYIKNSKDYPAGQPINEPYGYDSENSETPIYQSSIADVYAMRPSLVEVVNSYSGRSDTSNNINLDKTDTYDIFGNDVNIRANRDNEYISTLLFDTQNMTDDEKKFIRNFNPNYELPSAASLENNTYENYIASINAELDNNPMLRFHIFAQQVFTLLERIKRDEIEIFEKNGDHKSIPNYLELNKNLGGGKGLLAPDENNGGLSSGKANSCESKISNANGLEKWLMLLFPGTQSDEFTINPNLQFNPFRTDFLFGDAVNASSFYNDNYVRTTNVSNSIENSAINKILYDQLLGTPWRDHSADADSNYEIKGIDIRYRGQPILQLSEYDSRIKYLKFKLTYNIDGVTTDTEDTTGTAHLDTWEFTVYFDPDSFIYNTSEASKFKVWTYNDKDFDNELRKAAGNNFVYPTSEPYFNIYDNDYANVLLPEYNIASEGSIATPSIRNKFIASETEIREKFISELLKEIKGGGFSNYVQFNTTRVSPYIENGEIKWDTEDNHNLVEQTFYVFYKGTQPPTENQKITAVKSYLTNLHSHCHPTEYDKDGKVISIGHGTQVAEITNFLANMYPNLFTSSKIYIIPAKFNHYNSTTGESDVNSNPENYISTITPKRIVETVLSIGEFEGFGLSETGDVGLRGDVTTATGKIPFPIEMFNIGSISILTPNAGPQYSYNMPWYAVSSSIDTENVLTNIDGLKNYRPRLFTDEEISDSSSIATKFQIIMILLAKQMFKNPGHTSGNTYRKDLLTSILGISIYYSTDAIYDPSAIKGDVEYYNVAKFSLASTEFVVYAQEKKDFGFSQSNEAAPITSANDIMNL